MDLLFSPMKIGSRMAPNRFVSQPMEGNDGENGGAVSQRTLDRYLQFAKGKWGMTFVEAVSVGSDALARKNGLVISRRNLDSLKRLVDGYRAINKDGLLLFQISHAGRKAGPFSKRMGMYPAGEEDVHILTDQEVEQIREKLVDCIGLAREAGADGVDLKLCHGYLGAEMLRPANQRTDRWGGSFENRTRFYFSAIEELKRLHGDSGFILGSRISMYEGIRGGCGTVDPDSVLEDLSEMKQIIAGMAERGLDYLNVSAGIPGLTSDITRPTNQSRWFYLDHFRYCRDARAVAGEMSIIGSAYSVLKDESFSYGAENIRKGLVDFIGFGRQSFADPLLPEKMRTGKEINYCICCSGCTKLMIKQVNDGCVIYDPYYKAMLKASSEQ
jgi:2,4-dienoyl-CoA reductase-like NADH-dependent reductase (Old Yellow Enzyme family)